MSAVRESNDTAVAGAPRARYIAVVVDDTRGKGRGAVPSFIHVISRSTVVG